MRYPFALASRQTGQRLVHQQHLRFGAQRDAQIYQPLSAIGKLPGFGVLNAFKTEEFHQLCSFRMDLWVTVDIAPDVEAARVLRLQGQPQVFVDRQTTEQIGDLERTGQPLPADVLRRQGLNFLPVQTHGSGIRHKHARDQIEGRRLARAVRPDQRVDLTGVQGEPCIADGLNAAEVLVDRRHFQHHALARLGSQEGGQGQTFVNSALAHGRDVFDHRPPLALQDRPDADQSVWRIQDESDESQPEPEQPVFRPYRQQLAGQNVEQRAQCGAEKAAHAADHHHRQQRA